MNHNTILFFFFILPNFLHLLAGTDVLAEKNVEEKLILSLSGSGNAGHWWTGLTEEKKFVYVQLGSHLELKKYSERKAAPAEIKHFRDFIAQHGLLNIDKEYSAPLHLLQKPPGFPLTRLGIWKDSKHHEVSIVGMQFAPVELRKLITQLTETTRNREEGSIDTVDIVATIIDMDRTYRKNRTYADLRIKKGHKFIEVESSWWKNYLPCLLEAINYPGLFIPITADQLSKITDIENDRLLIEISGKHYELRIFRQTQ